MLDSFSFPKAWLPLLIPDSEWCSRAPPRFDKRRDTVRLTNDRLLRKQHYHFKSDLRLLEVVFLTGWLIEWKCSTNWNPLFQLRSSISTSKGNFNWISTRAWKIKQAGSQLISATTLECNARCRFTLANCGKTKIEGNRICMSQSMQWKRETRLCFAEALNISAPVQILVSFSHPKRAAQEIHACQ